MAMIELKKADGRRILVGTEKLQNSTMVEQSQHDTYLVIDNEKYYFKSSFDDMKALIVESMKAKTRAPSRSRRSVASASEQKEDSQKEKPSVDQGS